MQGINFKRVALMMGAVVLSVSSFATEVEETPSADGAKNENVIPTVQIGTSKIRFMGYGQGAYTATWQDDQTSNAMEVQRFILMADAQINDKISFWLMYDIANSKLHEYYAQYAFSPALKVRVGQYKQPFTLESLLPPTVISNIGMDESVSYMAGIGADDPCFGFGRVGRDVGIMLTGDAAMCDGKPLLNYSIGVFNGAGMNQKENNNQKDVIGMLNVMPFKNTKFSTSFILGTAKAQADSRYGKFVTGDNYKRNRFALGAEHKNSVVNLRSEAMWGNDGGVKSMGWYANAEFHLCKRLDLVANYDYLKRNMDVDDSYTNNYIAGLQYWVYRQCCIRSQYVRKEPKLSASTDMWVTQFQIAF
ncbi:MAG: hypothetical protein J5663_00550 [Bacteroidaceae bacterium]|nr:hypothetical protein [Bacteroidaceae bacterium]